jgi:hypothetical protein
MQSREYMTVRLQLVFTIDGFTLSGKDKPDGRIGIASSCAQSFPGLIQWTN